MQDRPALRMHTGASKKKSITPQMQVYYKSAVGLSSCFPT